MKQLMIFGMIMCLLASLVSAESISVENGKILGEKIYHPSFWESLKLIQFSFVGESGDVNLASSVCTRSSVSGELAKLGGESKSSGVNCQTNQYITFIASTDSSDGTIKQGQYIFDKLWLKSSSTDLVQWTNYAWVNQKSFNYYYVCYDCKSMTTTDTEKGCLAKDLKSCVTKSDTNCGTNYNFESVCLTHISSGGSSGGVPSTTATTISPKIEFGDIKITNDGNLKQGQLFEIKGMAYVTGAVNGGVIETGYTSDYFTPLTISTASIEKGACGDDKTTGVKFTASNTWVVFSLKLKAETLGKQKLRLISSPACGSGIILDSKDIYLNVEQSVIAPDTTQITNECSNNPTSPTCQPKQCTGAECDLTPCTNNCGGDSTVVIDTTKPKPNWFSTENLVIATVGMAILITFAYYTLKKKRK